MKKLFFNIRLKYREVRSYLYLQYKITLINRKYKTNFKNFKLSLKWI